MKEKRLKGHREEKVILNSRVRKGLAENLTFDEEKLSRH